MKLCAPRSESHNRAVVIRSGTNRCSLVNTGAANGIGTKHVMAWDIKQVDLAAEPAVHVIGSERTCRRAVMRHSGRTTKPETRSS